jgi:hypothetical protein
VSAAYLKARTLARAARAPGFRAQVDALAGRCGVQPRAWTDRPTWRDFHEEWRRRGAFLERISGYGYHFDVERQAIGLLPTDDPYAVIAAVCAPGADWGWVCPAFTIRDLKALERDYPFTLIGCDSRSLELQFAATIADPAGLARRLGSIRTSLGGPGLSEHPDDEELAEYLGAHARIGFSWE